MAKVASSCPVGGQARWGAVPGGDTGAGEATMAPPWGDADGARAGCAEHKRGEGGEATGALQGPHAHRA